MGTAIVGCEEIPFRDRLALRERLGRMGPPEFRVRKARLRPLILRCPRNPRSPRPRPAPTTCRERAAAQPPRNRPPRAPTSQRKLRAARQRAALLIFRRAPNYVIVAAIAGCREQIASGCSRAELVTANWFAVHRLPAQLALPSSASTPKLPLPLPEPSIPTMRLPNAGGDHHAVGLVGLARPVGAAGSAHRSKNVAVARRHRRHGREGLPSRPPLRKHPSRSRQWCCARS